MPKQARLWAAGSDIRFLGGRELDQINSSAPRFHLYCKISLENDNLIIDLDKHDPAYCSTPGNSKQGRASGRWITLSQFVCAYEEQPAIQLGQIAQRKAAKALDNSGQPSSITALVQTGQRP